MPRPVAPLNALRAFEVAARTGSFANAARELGVSPAAVSQQVKRLEGIWGATLFFRQGARIALTEAGQTAYPPLGRAMAALEELSDAMRRTERRRRLVLSAPHSVAETWLAERLAALDAAGARPALDIRIDDDPVDFERDKLDLRIFLGHHLYTEYRVEPLFTDELAPVASPGFIARCGDDPAGIADSHLIHTDWGPAFSTAPDWSRALAQTRVVDYAAGLRAPASSTALRLARQGLGAALVPRRMAQDDLSAGRVALLRARPIPMAHAYRIAFPARLAAHRTARSLIDALKEGAGVSGSD
jgi:LysR family glycine cleavage system transcriptional activator